MVGTTLKRRYHLEQQLGSSDRGDSYLATDTTTGEMLVAKIFPSGVSLRGEAGLRYLSALSRLESLRHPHLLLPVETGTSGGRVYQILPYFPGECLRDIIGAGAPDVSMGVEVLRQIVSALDQLHQAGSFHLNLKPANVLVTREEGQLHAVLTDPLRSMLHEAGYAANGDDTAYRAPELSLRLGAQPDCTSDLYGLGALAFELLTGRLPFLAGDTRQMESHHLASPPPNPRELNSEIPPRLAAIVLKLLAKQPGERYASAKGLLADLQDWDQEDHRGLGADDLPMRFPLRGVCVAREPVQDALLAALGRAHGGKGSWLNVEGATGSGRRMLVEQIGARIEAAHGLVLQAPSPPSGWSAPFQLPITLLSALLNRWPHLPDVHRQELLHRIHIKLGDSAGVLRTLLPEISALVPDAPTPLPLPPERERTRVLYALTEVFAALADPQHPLLLWLETVERADADSVDWMRHLQHRLPRTAMVVICGLTPGRLAPESPLSAWFATSKGSSGVQRVELPLLTLEQTVQQVHHLLGGQAVNADKSGDAGLALPLAKWLREHWGGNPMAQEMAVDLLISHGQLRCEGRSKGGGFLWNADWGGIRGAAPPEKLHTLAEASLARLEEGPLLMLEAAAVFPGVIEWEPLCALLHHLPRELVAGQVGDALAAGVIIRTDGGVRFCHAVFREAVYRRTAEARRDEYHRQLGAFLAAEADGAPLRLYHEAALHFREAHDTDQMRFQGVQAAQAAVDAHALRGACAWMESMLPNLTPGDERWEMLLALGRARALLGSVAGARESLAEVAAAAVTDDQLMEAHSWLARVEFARDQNEAAIEHIEEALSVAGETLPSSPVGTALARMVAGAGIRYDGLRVSAGIVDLQEPDPEALKVAELLELATAVLEPVAPHRAALADEKLVRLLSRFMPNQALARALIRMGATAGHPEAQPFEDAAALLRQYSFPYEEALLELNRARCYLAHCALLEARASLERAGELFGALGDVRGGAAVLEVRFELDRVQGPLTGLVMLAREHAALAGLCGEVPLMRRSSAMEAWGAAVTGIMAPAEAARRLLEAAEMDTEGGGSDDAVSFHALAAELMLGAGHSGEALDILQRAQALPRKPSLAGGMFDAALAECHLVRALERPALRERLLQEARGQLRRVQSARTQWPRIDLEYQRLEVLLKLLQGRENAALSGAEAAVEVLEPQGARLPLALLQLRVAQALKAGGGKDWLHWGNRALSRFESLGAGLYHRAACTLLELESFQEEPQSPAGASFGGANATAAHGDLLQLIEALGDLTEEGMALWERNLLQVLREAADADAAALFLPNRDGALELATRVPGDAHQGGHINRWLIDAVWSEGRGQALDAYYPTGSAEPGGYPDARSLMCIPLHSGSKPYGVVYFEGLRSRVIYDEGDLQRISALGRQAALALSLRAHLGRLAAERDREAKHRQSERHLQDWLTDAVALPDESSVLNALLDFPGFPCRAVAIAALWSDEQWFSWGGNVHGQGAGPEEGPPRPPSFETSRSCAAAAMASGQPRALRSASEPVASAEELSQLQRHGAGDGVWLPLLLEGGPCGLLLVMTEAEQATADSDAWSNAMEMLRHLAPALVGHRERQHLEGQLAAAQSAIEVQERQREDLQRYLPAPLRIGGEGLPTQAAIRPVLYGKLFGLAALNRHGEQQELDLVRDYYNHVRQALEMHRGELSRVLGPHWVGQFPDSPGSALYGVLTLYQTLETFRAENPSGNLPRIGTGLGLHIGTVLGGTVDAGDHLETVLLGEGVQIAQRLAELSITFRTGALISEELVQSLEDTSEFDLRHLGTFRMGPGEKRMGVYELYTMRPPKMLESMRRHQEEWEVTIRKYRHGLWREAATGFEEYLSRLPHDRPARHFLRQCRLRAVR